MLIKISNALIKMCYQCDAFLILSAILLLLQHSRFHLTLLCNVFMVPDFDHTVSDCISVSRNSFVDQSLIEIFPKIDIYQMSKISNIVQR